MPAIIGFLGYDPDPKPKNLPEFIAYARRRLGFTQDDLAGTLGVNALTVSNWENNLAKPSANRLDRIKELLKEASDGITSHQLE